MFWHLSTLDVRKSAGPDGLLAYFLREIAVEIAAPLAHYIICHCDRGLCHMLGSSPVHKGGSTDNPSHYRTIAVASVVAKVLEKIVTTQLSSYI